VRLLQVRAPQLELLPMLRLRAGQRLVHCGALLLDDAQHVVRRGLHGRDHAPDVRLEPLRHPRHGVADARRGARQRLRRRHGSLVEPLHGLEHAAAGGGEVPIETGGGVARGGAGLLEQVEDLVLRPGAPQLDHRRQVVRELALHVGRGAGSGSALLHREPRLREDAHLADQQAGDGERQPRGEVREKAQDLDPAWSGWLAVAF
jgi:hypothetical protein